MATNLHTNTRGSPTAKGRDVESIPTLQLKSRAIRAGRTRILKEREQLFGRTRIGMFTRNIDKAPPQRHMAKIYDTLSRQDHGPITHGTCWPEKSVGTDGEGGFRDVRMWNRGIDGAAFPFSMPTMSGTKTSVTGSTRGTAK
jgi:hypothetical protein